MEAATNDCETQGSIGPAAIGEKAMRIAGRLTDTEFRCAPLLAHHLQRVVGRRRYAACRDNSCVARRERSPAAPREMWDGKANGGPRDHRVERVCRRTRLSDHQHRHCAAMKLSLAERGATRAGH